MGYGILLVFALPAVFAAKPQISVESGLNRIHLLTYEGFLLAYISSIMFAFVATFCFAMTCFILMRQQFSEERIKNVQNILDSTDVHPAQDSKE